jgi:uncharacterized protein (DUF2141 family)
MAATFISRARLALAGITVCVAAQAEPTNTGAIAVTVGPLRNNAGGVACRLYTSSNGFPTTAVGTVNQYVKTANGHARCVFDKLKPGTYAVMVHHDENGNRKMDMNLFGMPLEGYGASNNHTHALSAPSWDESKVVVEAAKVRALSIGLRY